MNNEGVGVFQPEQGRAFNRNLLFNKSEIAPVLNIYTHSWLAEVRRCHLPLWAAADGDPDVKNLYSFIQAFKHDWEDFFQALSARFPDEAAGLISDFEYSGIEMFSNLEFSVVSGSAKTPHAEANLERFEAYLPEVKKLFIREARQGDHAASSSSEIDDSRPIGVADAIQMLYTQELNRRKNLWLRFRDLLNEAGLSIPIEEWPIPTDWNSKNVELIYNHLNDQISRSLDGIHNRDSYMTPDDNWELLLPEIFSFDLGRLYYKPMETYEDGIVATVPLRDGSELNISGTDDSSYLCYPPRDQCVASLETYIREGVRISRRINSNSNRIWRKAKANFSKHGTIINLPTSFRAMEELGRLLHEARIDLMLDIEDFIESEELKGVEIEQQCNISLPDLSKRDDCKRYLHEIYEFLRDHYKSKIHSETQAINYILVEAQEGNAYYKFCKAARDVKAAFNWERGTFTNYCKTGPSKRKGLKRAAKGRAKKRMVSKELKGL